MSHVSVFVSPELREAIERSAAENDRSLSAEVRVALRAYRLKSSGETSRSGEPVSLDRLGHGLDGRAYPSAIPRSMFENPAGDARSSSATRLCSWPRSPVG